MADYIDRDGYIKTQRELYCKNCPKREGMRNGKKQELYPVGGVVCRACELNDALDALEDYPAADVAPVVHGKWVKHGFVRFDNQASTGSVECSNCHRFLPMPENYCPNCGAMMEVGE